MLNDYNILQNDRVFTRKTGNTKIRRYQPEEMLRRPVDHD